MNTTACFNKITLTSIIAFCLALNGYSQSFLTNGLVAYYPFNGSANDESGHGNNGTDSGAFLTIDRFGNTNQAFFLPNSNNVPVGAASTLASCINVPSSILNGEASGTISAWIKPETVAYGGIFGKAHPYVSSRALFTFGGYTDPNNGNLPATGQPGRLYFLANGFGILAQSSGTISTGAWQHVVVTFTASGCRFYINGQSKGVTVGDFQIPKDLDAPYNSIGAVEGFTSDATHIWPQQWLYGAIDDVRIYERALSANEVQQLYTFEAQPFPCIAHTARATATVVNGLVAGAKITDGGCGYTNTPIVLIQGGGGSGATGTAVVSNSVVVAVMILDAGHGYTTPPSIYIDAPLGPQIGVLKAVKPTFSDLLPGANYQLQVSSDLMNWTNQGSTFAATSSIAVYPQYFEVDNWNQLFFRLQRNP